MQRTLNGKFRVFLLINLLLVEPFTKFFDNDILKTEWFYQWQFTNTVGIRKSIEQEGKNENRCINQASSRYGESKI